MLEKYRLKLIRNTGAVVESSRSEFVGLGADADKKQNKNNVLNMVFRRNEETGKPTNDLALVENLHLSAEVREFIKQNLQAPIEPEKGVIDSELALELCRKPYESVNDYRLRLQQVAYDSEEHIKVASSQIKKFLKRK